MYFYTKYNKKLCESEKKGSWKHEWHSVASVPYMHNKEGEWVSFENEESLEKKVYYILKLIV